jgi:peroxiredoxin
VHPSSGQAFAADRADVDGRRKRRTRRTAEDDRRLLLSPHRAPGRRTARRLERNSGRQGCTPQACAFRDHWTDLNELGVRLFGLSTQTSEYQREAVARLHLSFALLSDADLAWTTALGLPTFEVEGMTLVRRLTLVVRDGVVQKVFYPIFPPDLHPREVLDWLRRETSEASPAS